MWCIIKKKKKIAHKATNIRIENSHVIQRMFESFIYLFILNLCCDFYFLFIKYSNQKEVRNIYSGLLNS